MKKILRFVALLRKAHVFVWGKNCHVARKQGDAYYIALQTNRGQETLEVKLLPKGGGQVKYIDQLDWTNTDIRPATFIERLATLWRASFLFWMV